jgi:hypothetical protein
MLISFQNVDYIASSPDDEQDVDREEKDDEGVTK